MRQRVGPGFYATDLAYIHDSAYLGFARRTAPGILRLLSKKCSARDRIVEIGCGSGGLTEYLVKARYSVLALDYSPAMLALARKNVPGATFRRGSFYDFNPPACAAIVAAGEVFNYMQGGPGAHRTSVGAFFRCAHTALKPGGILVFDFLESSPSRPRRGAIHNSGEDWMVLVEGSVEDRILSRKITTIRRTGLRYRTSSEVHRQYLFTRGEMRRMLEKAGYTPTFPGGYGRMKIADGHAVVAAIREGD